MHDLLFGNPGHLEDPDLWRYADQIGLDIDQFNDDRRTDAVWDRVQHDFRAAIRGGVKEAPTLAATGKTGFLLLSGPIDTDSVNNFVAQLSNQDGA